MKSVIIAAAIVAATSFGLANAAGPFDGQYTGGSGPTGGRTGCPSTLATVSIVDGKMTGHYQTGASTYSINGTVAPDGTVTGRWAAYPFTGNFTGTHFAGVYTSKECGTGRNVTLDKTS